MRAFHRPRLWLGAWLAMLLATLLVCLAPLPQAPVSLSNFDKLEHALGYALLAAYAAMLFATPRALGVAATVLVAYGVAIEGLQALLPWRSFDPLDALANGVGVLLGTLLWPTPLARTLQRFDRAWA